MSKVVVVVVLVVVLVVVEVAVAREIKMVINNPFECLRAGVGGCVVILFASARLQSTE